MDKTKPDESLSTDRLDTIKKAVKSEWTDENDHSIKSDGIAKDASIPTTEQLEEVLKKKRYRKNYIRIFISTVESLIVVAAVAVLIATLVLPVLRVTGNSMNPTLYNDQLVICRKQGSFKQGDIIAFYYNNKILLKRVIGTEGDIINITTDGTVYVNNVALEEDYISEKAYGEVDIEFPYQVPADRVFVLGDNRATSVDSRSSEIGCVAEENVLGIVMLRIWPLKDAGGI